MTIAFSQYLTDVLPSVPACPRTTALNAIRDAAKDLCMQAYVWKETLAAINIAQGDDDYTLTPVTANTQISGIVYAEYDGVPISPLPEKELDERDYNWRNAGQGTPGACFLESPTVIKLNRKPDRAITGGLVVRVALMPNDSATGADDELYTHYKKAIVHGALFKLMQMPKKEWSDIKLANFHGEHANYQIQMAKTRADRSGLRRASRAKPRFFA